MLCNKSWLGVCASKVHDAACVVAFGVRSAAPQRLTIEGGMQAGCGTCCSDILVVI